ncbi:MAG: hypothetical protein Q8K55_13625 [Gemmatimonadaceae bacterium]|nr:hypothetical protein [Gemmatimonadaceae bacterium]
MNRLLFVLLFAPAVAGAQSYTYPSFQLPTLVEREYNFAAADGGRAGATLLFQWREAVSPLWQVGIDAGLADPDGNASSRLVLGGHVARQLTRATTEFPFDVALTAGIGFSGVDGHNVTRIPLGASVGHRFLLDNGMSITPFAHPRLSLDRCNDCKLGEADGKLNVAVDLGGSVQLTDQVALRVAATAGGSDYLGSGNGIGFSVAWTPKGLRK